MTDSGAPASADSESRAFFAREATPLPPHILRA